MDRLKIPNNLVSPGLTTPSQRRSPRDLLSPTGQMAAAEEQLESSPKRRMKFPWKGLLVGLVFVGLVAYTNKVGVGRRHDQPEMQEEDDLAMQFDQKFVAAEMAGLPSKRHDQPDMKEEDDVAIQVDQQFVEAAMAAIQAGVPIKRDALKERRYVDGVPADLYQETNPHPSSRQAEQLSHIRDKQKRDQLPLQRPPKVLDDFVDSHLWVPDASKLSEAEKDQIRYAAGQAAKTRRAALEEASGAHAASVDELEQDSRAWWSRVELSPDKASQSIEAVGLNDINAAIQSAKSAGQSATQAAGEKRAQGDKDTSYIQSRAKAFELQLQQGVAWEKEITTQSKPGAAADPSAAAVSRWTCIVSPSDNGARIKVGYVGTTSNLQCQGPNDQGCFWYPATDTNCVNAPWGRTAPVPLTTETGLKCTQYAAGWCGSARQALPGQTVTPASPNWKCVLSVADGGSYVSAGYVITNGAYTPDYQLQCQGPTATTCTWYWDATCSQPKSPIPVPGMGNKCLYYGGGWCQAARAVLPVNPTAPPPPPVNTRPRRNGADWMCIQNGTAAEWMFVSYISYDFGRIQCRGANYNSCTRFMDNKCSQKFADSWEVDWYWEAGVFCDVKSTGGPGWCQNGRRLLPAPYYYPTGAVPGGVGPGIVGYFPNWNAWAIPGYDFTSIAYVCYAFVQATPSGDLVPGETLADQGMMWQLNVQAKTRHPGLKTFVSFGGGGQSAWFAGLARSDAARKNFAAKVAQFITVNKFDGVDLDWECMYFCSVGLLTR
jgi:hypothetical protein